MRHVTLLALLVLASAAPTVQAGDLWMFPEAAYVGHPVQVAVRVEPADGRHGAPIDVRLRNAPLLHVTTAHGVDGVHVFTFTPPRPGILSIAFRDATMVDFVGEPTTGDPGRYVEREHIAVIPVLEPTLDPREVEVWNNASVHAETGGVGIALHISDLGYLYHDYPLHANVDVRDRGGRLMKSGLFADHQHHVAAQDLQATSATAQLLVLPRMDLPAYVKTQMLNASWTGTPRGPALGVPDDEPLCGAEVRLDAPLLPDGTRVLPIWSTLHVVRDAPGAEPTRYELRPATPDPEGRFPDQITPRDPLRAAAFRAWTPGQHDLVVTTEAAACRVPLTVLPAGDARPGTALVDVTVMDGGNATISLQARREDVTLAPYAFDTRVYRLDTPGRPGELVWMGTQISPGDPAQIQLYDLAPGDYEVRTYPAPLALELPPVATSDAEGFRATFTVPWPLHEDAAVVPARNFESPAPALVPLLLAALLLTGLARRR